MREWQHYRNRIFASMLCCMPMTAALAGESEVLMGYTIGADGVTYQVPSFGCTAKKHFNVVRMIGPPLVIELIRINSDLCEQPAKFGTKITFTYKELKVKPGSKFVIGNKLQPDYEAP